MEISEDSNHSNKAWRIRIYFNKLSFEICSSILVISVLCFSQIKTPTSTPNEHSWQALICSRLLPVASRIFLAIKVFCGKRKTPAPVREQSRALQWLERFSSVTSHQRERIFTVYRHLSGGAASGTNDWFRLLRERNDGWVSSSKAASRRRLQRIRKESNRYYQSPLTMGGEVLKRWSEHSPCPWGFFSYFRRAAGASPSCEFSLTPNSTQPSTAAGLKES